MRACWLKWVGRDWSISADYIWLNYSDANTVSAVRPATAQLVGLGVHRGVHDLFGESGEQLPHVDGAVAETGHGEYVRRRV